MGGGGEEGSTQMTPKKGGWLTDLCTFVYTRLHQFTNPLLGIGGDEGTNVSSWLVTCVHLKLLSSSDYLWDPLFSGADENGGRESHAPLTCGTKSRTHQLVDSVLLVGIWENDAVVLGTLWVEQGEWHHMRSRKKSDHAYMCTL